MFRCKLEDTTTSALGLERDTASGKAKSKCDECNVVGHRQNTHSRPGEGRKKWRLSRHLVGKRKAWWWSYSSQQHGVESGTRECSTFEDLKDYSGGYKELCVVVGGCGKRETWDPWGKEPSLTPMSHALPGMGDYSSLMKDGIPVEISESIVHIGC